MKRLVYLMTAALLAMMILVPTAMAQDTSGSTMGSTSGSTTSGGQAAGDLPESGGPAILLPGAALAPGCRSSDLRSAAPPRVETELRSPGSLGSPGFKVV